jgi:hypothetical protein
VKLAIAESKLRLMKGFVARSRADCERVLLRSCIDSAVVTPEQPQSKGCRRNLEASFTARGGADSSATCASFDDQTRDRKTVQEEQQLADESYQSGNSRRRDPAARCSDAAAVNLTSSLCLSQAAEEGVCRGDRACKKETVFKTPEQLRHALFPDPGERMASSQLSRAVVPQQRWAPALCPTPERPWEPTLHVDPKDSCTGPVGASNSSELQHPHLEPEHEIVELRHHIVGLVLARVADAAETKSLKVQLLHFKQGARHADILFPLLVLKMWRDVVANERRKLILSTKLERRAGRERFSAALIEWRRRVRRGREVARRVEATKTRAVATSLQALQEVVAQSSAR